MFSCDCDKIRHSFIVNHAPSASVAIATPRSEYDLPQSQKYFCNIYLSRLLCLYYSSHIYNGILLLYCIKLRKIIYAFTQNVKTQTLGLGTVKYPNRDASCILSIEQNSSVHANLASNKLTLLCVPYPLSASFIC